MCFAGIWDIWPAQMANRREIGRKIDEKIFLKELAHVVTVTLQSNSGPAGWRQGNTHAVAKFSLKAVCWWIPSFWGREFFSGFQLIERDPVTQEKAIFLTLNI